MKIRFAIIFVAACALSTGTLAQQTTPSAAKRELAVRVVASQQGAEMDRLIQQLAGSAVQPMFANWAPKLAANVPASRQEAAASDLNAELQRYGEDAAALIRSKVAKVSDESLVEAYMDRFTEDELRQLNAFFTAPVIKKYQTVAPQLGALMVEKLIEASRPEMQERARLFDEAALKIVGPDRPPAPPALAAPAPERPAGKAKK